MARNLFSQLCKYKPTEFVTPLENFCTEAFVYLIDKFRKKNNSALAEVMKLFGINDDNFTIETQTVYYNKSGFKFIPDILIKTNDKYTIIEVKVDALLHSSKIGLKDQLDDYCNLEIDGKKCDVYCLSKSEINSDSISPEKKIKWSKIHEIMKKDDEELVKQFVEFLENNNMSGYEKLNFDISRITEEKSNFNDIVKNAFEKSKFNSTYKLEEKGYIASDGNGWYINSCDEAVFWVGVIPDRKKYVSKIVFEILSHKEENFSSVCNGKEKDDWNNIIIKKTH